MPIKDYVICFDFWNTLAYSTQTDGASYEQVLISSGVKKEEIYPVVRDNLMNKKMSYKQMASFLLNFFKINDKVVFKHLVENWVKDNGQVVLFEGVLKSLSNLKKEGAKLVLISNITHPARKVVSSIFGQTDIFDRYFLSCEHSMTKPNIKICRQVEQWFPKTFANNFYMIGDNQKDDLDLPSAIGWQTLQADKKGLVIKNLYKYFKEVVK